MCNRIRILVAENIIHHFLPVRCLDLCGRRHIIVQRSAVILFRTHICTIRILLSGLMEYQTFSFKNNISLVRNAQQVFGRIFRIKHFIDYKVALQHTPEFHLTPHRRNLIV